ncbi:hypothetical protein E1297_04695 [Roseibium sp. RKSG952]|nr:hypothetical protein [Roseibium sp. RKSG952]
MGKLLDFASAPRPASRVEPSAETGPDGARSEKGEVILFPGVRYQRAALDWHARIMTIGAKADTGTSGAD